MKIYISQKITKKPKGGAFTFLATLKDKFTRDGIYTKFPEEADVILMSSHHNAWKNLRFKLIYPQKIFIHRIDGPIRLYNNENDKRDYVINLINFVVADGTIFQSRWSRGKNYEMGLKKSKFETVIQNAPDDIIFNRNGNFKEGNFKNRRVRLIASAWSSNWKKGYEAYQWLDENLNFEKYEMIFIGNSPVGFRNIKMIGATEREELSSRIKGCDIFITASENDPCSNSLIEAMACGLPAIVFNSGGHSEIIKKGGEIFDDIKEVPFLIEKIKSDYNSYKNRIDISTFDEVSEKYFNFASDISKRTREKKYIPKNISLFIFLKTFTKLLLVKLFQFFDKIIRK